MPTVTGKVYNHSKRMKEKRAVLDGVAAELRRIIGWPAETGRLSRLIPAIADERSLVIAKLTGLPLLKHAATRHLARGAFTGRAGKWAEVLA